MSSRSENDEHAELVSYALGELDASAAVRFERHLEGCAACRAELTELAPIVELSAASAGLDVEPPPGLVDSVVDRIEAEARAGSAPPASVARPTERSGVRIRWPRIALALAGAAAVAAIAFVIGRAGGEDSIGPGDPDAPVELNASIDGPAGSAEVEVRRLASGREIEFRSDELPVLPADDFYELWFVADSDGPGSPDRISAGTFHPDEEGFTDVIMHAAVVPSLYPNLEVTLETDNRPENGGDVVLRLEAADLITEG